MNKIHGKKKKNASKVSSLETAVIKGELQLEGCSGFFEQELLAGQVHVA